MGRTSVWTESHALSSHMILSAKNSQKAPSPATPMTHGLASIAQDNTQAKKADKQPISLHPAFPFIVALWFAALLGLGSLVVPVELIETVVVRSGLSSIVPPTAPPLGFTARALIALALPLPVPLPACCWHAR